MSTICLLGTASPEWNKCQNQELAGVFISHLLSSVIY